MGLSLFQNGPINQNWSACPMNCESMTPKGDFRYRAVGNGSKIHMYTSSENA